MTHATPKLVGLSGSLRAASFNTKLLHQTLTAFGPAEVEVGSLDLPLYSGDVETVAIPDAVTALAAQIASSDGVIVASPEYNKGITGVLKNALDWISRVPGGAFAGKPVLLISAAAGRGGGETAMFMTRQCLSALNARVLTGPAVMVAGAHNAFGEDGKVSGELYVDTIAKATAALREEIALRA